MLMREVLKTLSIPDRNTKVDCPLFNVVPISTCGPLRIHCKAECYDMKSWIQYPSVRAARRKNLAAVLDGSWFAPMDCYLTKRKPEFFRGHAGGDFNVGTMEQSRRYARQWLQLARRHPETRFLFFTKAFQVIKGLRVPDNVALVASAFPRMTDLDMPGRVMPWAMAGQSGQYEGCLKRRAEKAFHCPGECRPCGFHCWKLRGSESVQFDMH